MDATGSSAAGRPAGGSSGSGSGNDSSAGSRPIALRAAAPPGFVGAPATGADRVASAPGGMRSPIPGADSAAAVRSGQPGGAAATGEPAAGNRPATDGAASGDQPATDRAGRTDNTGTDQTAGTDNPGRENSGTDKAAGTENAGTDKAAPADGDAAGTRADGEPGADGWAAFAPAPEPVPGRARRILNAVGRTLIHEYTLASLAALLLAVVLTWPTLRYPMYTIPQDVWDPTLQAWQMAWSGHILLTDPAQLWHSNTFFPERYSFAFSDSLLGYAPAGMLGNGPAGAILRYNIVFVLAHALAVLGAYALVRQLGSGRLGAAVAGVVFAYAPWRLAQEGHLHIISSGGIALALAMLARGHGWSLRHGVRAERRHAGWALAGWLVAAWQISLGFGIGLPFAYVLAGVVLVGLAGGAVRRVMRRPRRRFGWRLLAADLAGGTVFGAVGALLALPYFKVIELHPYAQRTYEELRYFSPPLRGFFIAPAESAVWGAAHEQARAGLAWVPEMTLLGGFGLYALALGGLVYSVWTVRQRLLLAAGVLVSAVLAMGTSVLDGRYTYAPLFEYLPGWSGIRTPGRLVLWTTLFLGILAAGAVSEFARRAHHVAADRVPARPGPWLRVAMLVPLLVVLFEGRNDTPHPIVPLQPAALRTVDGPMLVLPTDPLRDQHVMLWSTSRFQPVVNGGSGFTPRGLERTREVVKTFPDPASIEYLRGIGVRTVVLLREQAGGTPWETIVDLPVDSFGIQRQDLGEAVVFRL